MFVTSQREFSMIAAEMTAVGLRWHRREISCDRQGCNQTPSVCELDYKKGSMAANDTELRALMLAGLGGDSAAHRALLLRLSKILRDYYRIELSRIGQGPADAEDLVQIVLLAVHTHRHTYNPSEPFTPWLHAISRYKFIDHLRRTRVASASVPIDDAAEALARDDHIGTECALDLDRLLALLPEKMCCAIRRVKLEGLSIAEAAIRCGMSEAAVKVNVHRGLKTLAAAIGHGNR